MSSTLQPSQESQNPQGSTLTTQQFDGIRQGKKGAFLAALEDWPSVRAAAEASGITRQTHYNWMEDPEYAKAFEESAKRGNQSMRDEAVERSKDRTRNDTMLIFLLKGAFPDIYRDRASVEHTAKDGKPLFPLEPFRAYLRQAPEDGETLP